MTTQRPRTSSLEGMALPTAALVLDTRNQTPGNYVLKTLQAEIDTLCQDLHTEQIRQWRYLKHFIDYQTIGSLDPSELQKYREPYANTRPTSTTSAQQEHYVPSLMGRVDTHTNPTLFRGTPQRQDIDGIPEGNFKDRIRSILRRCDQLRTKRVNATSDLGNNGQLGPTRLENIVRVILLADAQNKESLATAATYAAYLREETLFQNTYREQLLLSTIIICLNHDNRGQAPQQIIESLSWMDNDTWPHIDSCIFVEKYGEHGARLTSETQEEHIEFLLYTLLITDPYQLRIDIDKPDLSAFLSQSKKVRMLPSDKCYSIGLSAFTYSVRWGRMLINNGLTAHIAEEWNDSSTQLSRDETIRIASQWFETQFTTVYNAIPTQIAGDLPELLGLTRAEKVIQEESTLFPQRTFDWSIGRDSLTRLDHYKADIESTYSALSPQEPGLQDAIHSVPRIHDYASRWTGDAGSPFMQVLTNAYRVLTEKPFFTGTKGALPRAKHQLNELAAVIAERHRTHDGEQPEIVQQWTALNTLYARNRSDLDAMNQKFPLLGSKFKGAMQWLSLLLWDIAIGAAILSGLAWVYHLIPNVAPAMAQFLGQSVVFLPSLTIFSLISFILAFTLIIIISAIGRRQIFGNSASPLRVEVVFLLSLVIFSIFGGIVSISLRALATDIVSLGVISWLSSLPYISVLTLVIALVVSAIEVMYFFKWHGDVERERQRIAQEINTQHTQTIASVKKYLAEAFLFAILKRALLIDEAWENPGHYYTDIRELSMLLANVQQNASEQYETTQQHLERIAEHEIRGPESDKLYLREELLDVTALDARLNELKATMHTSSTFIDFTEILLRAPSAELPTAILRHIESKQRTTQAQFLGNNYQKAAYLLLSMLAAQAIELTLEEPHLLNAESSQLEKRFKALDQRYQNIQISNLLLQIKNMFSAKMGTRRAQSQVDTNQAVTALTAWTQTFWENDQHLQDLLTLEGVVARMEHRNYEAQTVRTKFIIRSAPTSRSISIGQPRDAYILVHPSAHNSRLVRNLDIPGREISFPDDELFALLSLSYYVAQPYEVQEEPVQQLPQGFVNGTHAGLLPGNGRQHAEAAINDEIPIVNAQTPIVDEQMPITYAQTPIADEQTVLLDENRNGASPA